MGFDGEYIPISSLQHYIYCPRQCALIYTEKEWEDNLYTVRGEIFHEKVDTETEEVRGNKKIVRGLHIYSKRFGLAGRCDVVEVVAESSDGTSCSVRRTKHIMPVEFKVGEPKDDSSDSVQLCAQAFCLEEMFDIPIECGAFFYGKIRRRVTVPFTEELRRHTTETIINVRHLLTSGTIPQSQYTSKCRNCSIEHICMPRAMNEQKLIKYLHQLYMLSDNERG
ncbi:MAG: CRISPR-associated protein Cas4 [Bacteroidetes bacterium]|nr:CRISPR-associated protein Cas4 [Bacteroidota bacterium]